MIWITTPPTESGQYRWREHDQARVHSVRVAVKKGAAQYACKTMDLRRIAAGGQWSLKSAEVAVDPLDGLLATA